MQAHNRRELLLLLVFSRFAIIFCRVANEKAMRWLNDVRSLQNLKESVMQRVSFEMSYERKNTMESIMPNEKGELTVGSCRVVISWHNSKDKREALEDTTQTL